MEEEEEEEEEGFGDVTWGDSEEDCLLPRAGNASFLNTGEGAGEGVVEDEDDGADVDAGVVKSERAEMVDDEEVDEEEVDDDDDDVDDAVIGAADASASSRSFSAAFCASLSASISFFSDCLPVEVDRAEEID